MHRLLKLPVNDVHEGLYFQLIASRDQIERLLLRLYEGLNVDQQPFLALLDLLLEEAEDRKQALSELIDDQGPLAANRDCVLVKVGHVLIDEVLLFTLIPEGLGVWIATEGVEGQSDAPLSVEMFLDLVDDRCLRLVALWNQYLVKELL